MESLNLQWAAADERHRVLGASLPGLRVLRQDPVECLFSFICSSNNNIPRINLILARLRARYGALVGEFEGKEYYSFPTIEALAAADESDLRAIGLGYRARFIRDTAKHLVQVGGRPFLESLAALPVSRASRIKVQEELCKCVGVGRKVADCVALFSMGRCDAVPVDTHVWTMACRDFRAETLPPLARAEKQGTASSGASASASATQALGSAAAAAAASTSSGEAGQEQPRSPRGKGGRKKAPLPLLRSSEELQAAASLTPRVYESVGELFRQRFGSHAGWAHCVMFAAELPAFRRWLPKEMADEISRFEEDERKRNKERKQAAKERTAARKKAKEGAGDEQAATSAAGGGSEG